MIKKFLVLCLACVLSISFIACSFFWLGVTNEEVSDTVTDTVSDTVNSIAGTVTETVNDTIEKVTDTVTGTVGDTIEQVTDTIGTAADMYTSDVMSEASEISSAICDGINAHQTEISLTLPSSFSDGSELFEIFTQCFNENPSWFWISGNMDWSTSTLGDRTTAVLTPEIIGNIEDVPAMEEQLMNFVSEIAAGAAAYETQYEQALYVHDTIVNICDYDTATYEQYAATGEAARGYTYTAYGCLINHQAVCEGYARAFQLIMQKLGIECRYVSGTATSSGVTESHAWNYVVIDGTPCYVDVTWDDPVGDVPEGYISHDYFCVSEEQLLLDHTIESM